MPVPDAAETMNADDVADLAAVSRRTVEVWLYRSRTGALLRPMPMPDQVDGVNRWDAAAVREWLAATDRLPMTVTQWAERMAETEPGNPVNRYIAAITAAAPQCIISSVHGIRYRPHAIGGKLPAIRRAVRRAAGGSAD